MKFTYYESQGFWHWVAHSPFLSWVYEFMSVDAFGRLNGSVESITSALLVVKPWFAKAAVLGGAVVADHCLSALATGSVKAGTRA
jgi:uncharacterized membrane protein YkgB